MVTIVAYGVPPESAGILPAVVQALQEAVAKSCNVVVRVPAEDVVVFFPMDLMKLGLGEEISMVAFNLPVANNFRLIHGMILELCNAVQPFFEQAKVVCEIMPRYVDWGASGMEAYANPPKPVWGPNDLEA